MIVRAYTIMEADAVWDILGPVLQEGATYPMPQNWSKDEALAWWLAAEQEVFVADEAGQVVGTYYLRANQKGGGDHVANSGFITRVQSRGRGVARAMCEHSLAHAKARGYQAMQFNFVVSTNLRAMRLWQSLGFATVGTVPKSFRHPAHGLVSAHVLHRLL